VLKKLLLFIFLLILITISIIANHVNQAMHQPLPLTEPQLLVVAKGESVTSFANQLVSLGWLENNLYLKGYVKVFPQYIKIKAGTYQVSSTMNLLDLLSLLVSGKEHQFSVTFIEGSTFKDVLAQLSRQPYIKQTLTGLTVSDISERLGITYSNPEGWFAPDTYAFTSNTSDLAILKRSYKQMEQQLNTLWSQRNSDLPYESAYQILIMASIIEKETSHIPEQPVISGVFLNRLRKNMRLQTDPTVIYGLGERYKGDITRAHLREKTLYNTYRINGLPPTPIAMPGLSAIQAAINPANTDYFYFVSQGNGQHTFSKTLSEHNVALRLYLKNQKQKQISIHH
jgi:UPF0755 protein